MSDDKSIDVRQWKDGNAYCGMEYHLVKLFALTWKANQLFNELHLQEKRLEYKVLIVCIVAVGYTH